MSSSATANLEESFTGNIIIPALEIKLDHLLIETLLFQGLFKIAFVTTFSFRDQFLKPRKFSQAVLWDTFIDPDQILSDRFSSAKI